MKSTHKSSVPELSFEQAGRILERAFEANEMENNTIPLEVLASYSRLQKRSDGCDGDTGQQTDYDTVCGG